MKKKHLIKPAFLLVSFLLILSFTVGGTLAYLIEELGTFGTTFVPGSVECEIAEKADGYTVKNCGNTNVYIRAALVLNWTKNGNVYGFRPITAADYEIIADGWREVDGYLVCEKPVEPGRSTPAVAVVMKTEAPEECELKIEFLAEAIQSEPASVAAEAWGFTE